MRFIASSIKAQESGVLIKIWKDPKLCHQTGNRYQPVISFHMSSVWNSHIGISSVSFLGAWTELWSIIKLLGCQRCLIGIIPTPPRKESTSLRTSRCTQSQTPSSAGTSAWGHGDFGIRDSKRTYRQSWYISDCITQDPSKRKLLPRPWKYSRFVDHPNGMHMNECTLRLTKPNKFDLDTVKPVKPTKRYHSFYLA